MNKEELNKLEIETAKIFNRHGFVIPKRILPNIIFDWMTPEYCFKVRMRTIISELRTNKNFEVLEDGSLFVENGDKPILLFDSSKTSLVDEIKEYLKKNGFDLDDLKR